MGMSMYKAIYTPTGAEIVILSLPWKKRISELRQMDQADLLVCQGCQQPLRVKAGEHKRYHFAHKHLKACSFGTESPEILNARAVLYIWLEKQFGGAVTVEKPLPGMDLPRPVDCWVEVEGGAFAYWLIEAGIKLEPRLAIKSALALSGIKGHPIFLLQVLNEEKKEFQSVLLSPTERAFLQTTPYDAMEAGAGTPGGTLHYLDAEQESLTTYRALTLFHRPNWFKGIKKRAPLDELLVSRTDGGIIHPGEMTRLHAIRARQSRLQAKQQKFQERAQDWESRLSEPAPETPPRSWEPARAYPDFDVPLPCATCGQVTTDYWSTFFDDTGKKVCRCRDCLAKGE
jgi:hypothetical protein